MDKDSSIKVRLSVILLDTVAPVKLEPVKLSPIKHCQTAEIDWTLRCRFPFPAHQLPCFGLTLSKKYRPNIFLLAWDARALEALG